MAKRKRRKKKKEKSLEIRPEVYAILLIILAVLAYGPGTPLGFIGRMARCFAVFLFGSLDWLFIVSVLFIGIYMLFKGKSPSFWSTKFIGLLLVSFGILVFAHMNYIVDVQGGISDIYDKTIEDIMSTWELIKDGSPFVSPGGGIVGCSIAVLFKSLFAITGAKIVSVIFIVVGTCLFTGFSIREFFDKATEKSKELITKSKDGKKKDKDEDDDSDDEKKDSVVIINDFKY